MRRLLAMVMVACVAAGVMAQGISPLFVSGLLARRARLGTSADPGTPDIAWYKFEFGAFTTDSSGNSRTLINSGASNVDDATRGFVADFNGTSASMSAADNAAWSLADTGTDKPISITAWICMDDATTFRITGRYGSVVGTHEWLFSTTTADQIFLSIFDAQNDRIGRTYTTALTSNEGSWIHVAATYNGSRTAAGFKLYVSGVQVDNGDFSSGVYDGAIDLAVTTDIGALPQISSYANGKIDDLRYYGRVLTADEIQYLANH